MMIIIVEKMFVVMKKEKIEKEKEMRIKIIK